MTQLSRRGCSDGLLAQPRQYLWVVRLSQGTQRDAAVPNGGKLYLVIVSEVDHSVGRSVSVGRPVVISLKAGS